MTQTFPPPPPGATVLVGAWAPALFVEALVPAPAAAGLGLVCGLKRLPIAESGFAGEAEGEGVGDAILVFFWRLAAGELAAEGEAPLEAAADGEAEAAGDAAVFAADFFSRWRFVGDAEASGEALGLGDCARAKEAVAEPTATTSRRCFKRTGKLKRRKGKVGRRNVGSLRKAGTQEAGF